MPVYPPLIEALDILFSSTRVCPAHTTLIATCRWYYWERISSLLNSRSQDRKKVTLDIQFGGKID